MSGQIDDKPRSRSEAPLKEGTGGVGIEHKGCKFKALFYRLGFAET
jgi:hypothetical protein